MVGLLKRALTSRATRNADAVRERLRSALARDNRSAIQELVDIVVEQERRIATLEGRYSGKP